MNWDAIGAFGEILGATAVFVTLAYLAAQIRQANDLARFNASKDLLNQFNDLNRIVATDSEVRRALMKPGELTDDEREQVYNVAMMFCNVWMSVQTAFDNGQVDENFYKAGAKDVHIEIDRFPNFGPAVETWLPNYPENFVHKIFEPAVKT